MKKKEYSQPTMEICELEINQPILAGSDTQAGTEQGGQNTQEYPS